MEVEPGKLEAVSAAALAEPACGEEHHHLVDRTCTSFPVLVESQQAVAPKSAARLGKPLINMLHMPEQGSISCKVDLAEPVASTSPNLLNASCLPPSFIHGDGVMTCRHTTRLPEP